MTATIDYYNKNAKEYSRSTTGVDFSATQERFLKYLPQYAKILDFGCGAGRDTKAFLENGFDVDAIDGSEELCKIASAYTGIAVKQMFFQQLDAIAKYDGIWACASILHLPYDELVSVTKKMSVALKPSGIIYTSFKYGTFFGERNSRYFSDFTEQSFADFLKNVPELKCDEFWISTDVRPNRSEERWMNIILSHKAVL